MKYLTSTYLNGITDYDLTITFDKKKDYVVVSKKIKKIKEPFCLIENGKQVVVLNKDYHIVEILPQNKNYIVRIFVNEKLNIVEYFFLMTKHNQIKDGIPCFEDKKLALVYCSGQCNEYNKNKLDKLYANDCFEKTALLDDYEALKKEIISKTNFVFDLKIKDLIGEEE